MKSLADTTYNELIREQWGMFHFLPRLFHNPKAFLIDHPRQIGVFCIWIAILLWMFESMFRETYQLQTYIQDYL